MAVVPSANPLGAIRAHLLLNPTSSSRIFPAERKRPLFLNLLIRRDILRVCCSNLKEDTDEALSREDAQNSEGGQWAIFKPWDVPWDWKVTTYIMMPYLMSACYIHPIPIPTKKVLSCSLKTVAKLLVLYIFVSPHQPLPDDVFSLEWASPFNFKNGWIIWAVGGLSVASFVAFVVKAFISGLYAGHADNETEHLARLLPMIGSSNFRFPMTFSVVATSTIFTLAHQSPGKSLEIFIFGTVLGLIYAQTRNLLVPITMHILWNSAVILLLTFLHVCFYLSNTHDFSALFFLPLTAELTIMQSQGYDIHKKKGTNRDAQCHIISRLMYVNDKAYEHQE
ncbi:hypothetical protein IEQ34_010266 [Dendrobium chrysotoxum]|uniref:CAAX prenyl protease 2/Lysostaphin resistance protein A-like domain-containing protein n=1 Tax=Dendrobium chrysotoxum TaxID=161865 RepID=A0AAV7H0U7_DENCH|nr:hypothetical protein IEQ34_010266 [Dendrobium chrysotoxum]